jgi:hypothetical protein
VDCHRRSDSGAGSQDAGFSRDGSGTVTKRSGCIERIGSAGAGQVAVASATTRSDAIGFTYASWDPDAAAENFVGDYARPATRSAARTGG